MTEGVGCPEYHKIDGPFKRHVDGPDKNKIIWWEWSRPEFQALAYARWNFTEKLDGTNIRVHWDGHSPMFYGRTDRAILPGPLSVYLKEAFPEELFEQKFGSTPVTLYGEGIGAGIQKGGRYGDTQSFALFDVKIGNWWLRPPGVRGVAEAFGVATAPEVPARGEGTLVGGLFRVAEGHESYFGGGFAEGIVGTPECGLLDRSGRRIIVKIKHCDFYDGRGR